MRFLLYRSHTLPTAAAPVPVAAGLALRDGVFAPVPLLFAFVGSWLIHLTGGPRPRSRCAAAVPAVW